MKEIFRKLPNGILSLIATCVVLYLSLSSNPLDVNDMPLFKHADKVAHLIMYLTLTLVYSIEYCKKAFPKYTKLSNELFIIMLTGTIGGVMEVAQGFMNIGRTMSSDDAWFNCFGAILGFLLYHYLIKERLHSILKYRNGKRHHRSSGDGTSTHHHHHHHKNNEN